MYSVCTSFALYFGQLDNNKKYMYLKLFKIIVLKEWFQSTIWLLYFRVQSPPSLPPPLLLPSRYQFFHPWHSVFIPLPTLWQTCPSFTSSLLPTGCQYFLHNKLSLFPFPISHPSIHPFIHWSTSSALPPAIFPPFINHSLPFILSSFHYLLNLLDRVTQPTNLPWSSKKCLCLFFLPRPLTGFSESRQSH